MSEENPYSIMFVCLGNICRSPLADVIFNHLLKEADLLDKFYVESCGTGAWHVGSPAHGGSREIAKANGISLENHQAQQLSSVDFDRFDLFVAMDRSNKQDILNKPGGKGANVICLREFDEQADSLDVPDPYSLPRDSFKTVYEMIYRSSENLLTHLRTELGV